MKRTREHFTFFLLFILFLVNSSFTLEAYQFYCHLWFRTELGEFYEEPEVSKSNFSPSLPSKAKA